MAILVVTSLGVARAGPEVTVRCTGPESSWPERRSPAEPGSAGREREAASG